MAPGEDDDPDSNLESGISDYGESADASMRGIGVRQSDGDDELAALITQLARGFEQNTPEPEHRVGRLSLLREADPRGSRPQLPTHTVAELSETLTRLKALLELARREAERGEPVGGGAGDEDFQLLEFARDGHVNEVSRSVRTDLRERATGLHIPSWFPRASLLRYIAWVITGLCVQYGLIYLLSPFPAGLTNPFVGAFSGLPGVTFFAADSLARTVVREIFPRPRLWLLIVHSVWMAGLLVGLFYLSELQAKYDSYGEHHVFGLRFQSDLLFMSNWYIFITDVLALVNMYGSYFHMHVEHAREHRKKEKDHEE